MHSDSPSRQVKPGLPQPRRSRRRRLPAARDQLHYGRRKRAVLCIHPLNRRPLGLEAKGLTTVLDSAAGGEPVGRSKPDWWNTEQTEHTQLSELVAGLDEVSSLPIPYGRLPRRAYNVYAQEFPRWSDIAGQTPHTLLSRPKAGVATVRALVAAAEAAVSAYRAAATADRVGAVAAVDRLVEQLDERDRVMLSARVWARQPGSQRTLAQRLGVPTVWAQRTQPRAEERFADLLADPAHSEVGEHAAELCRRLGPSYRPTSPPRSYAPSTSTRAASPLRYCCIWPVPMRAVATGWRTQQ